MIQDFSDEMQMAVVECTEINVKMRETQNKL